MTAGLKTCWNIARSAAMLLLDELDEFWDLGLLNFEEEDEFSGDGELPATIPSGGSNANTTSWKWPTNSGLWRSASLHIMATSSVGFQYPVPKPNVPIQSLLCLYHTAILRAVWIFSLINSFSCLKEYFFPERSSFGLWTGQTDIIGRALNFSQVLYRSGPSRKTTRYIRYELFP